MSILALVEVLETQGMIFLQVLNCKMIGVLKNVTSGLVMALERLSLLLLHSSPLFPLQRRKVEFVLKVSDLSLSHVCYPETHSKGIF